EPRQAVRRGRFFMLETIREYAAELLEEDADHDRLRDLHLGFFLALVVEAEPKVTGPDQAEWDRPAHRRAGQHPRGPRVRMRESRCGAGGAARRIGLAVLDDARPYRRGGPLVRPRPRSGGKNIPWGSGAGRFW